jgi:hypothetical protein
MGKHKYFRYLFTIMNGWTKGRQELWRMEEKFDKDAVLSLILFKLCRECVTKEALKDFGDF